MRSLLAIAAALIAFTAVAAPAAAGRADPLASVRVHSCQLGLTSIDRTATYDARVRTIPGASAMWIHFSLYRRLASGEEQPVTTPELMSWRKSRTGVGSFAYSQRVDGLEPGSAYAMTVEFRWVDRAGNVIRHAVRTSRSCSEQSPLAALQLDSITGSSGGPGASWDSETYDVDLTNSGLTDLNGAELVLAVDRDAPVRTELGPIVAGAKTTVELSGTICERRVRVFVVGRLVPRQAAVSSSGCPPVS